MSDRSLSATTRTGGYRIQLLDIYRGFALLGIYLVNIRFMASSVIYPEAFDWMREETINQSTWWVLENFFNA
ncbi:MAG TPA: hypothetical protein VHI78_11260, partial [Bacteroidales bacterium]|nr:hypothetical protein [Bacteroidales bacterium]